VNDVSSTAQVAAVGWSLYLTATAVGPKTGLDIRGTTVPPLV